VNTVIAQMAARWITPIAAVLAVYLIVRGHHSFGGGFLAAAVIGLAVVFRRMTIGAESVEKLIDRGVGDVVASGLLIVIATGFAGFVWGDGFLRSASLIIEVPIVGEIVLPSTLLFEIGVVVVVVGVVVAVIRELGGTFP
jgi:multisubunit Na+/H+ antiporter MnhB subunit